MEESATHGRQKEGRKTSGKIHLQLVQPPHGVDGPHAFRLHPGLEAQGRPEERQQQQSQPCRPCILGHHHPQQLLRGPIGHACNHEQQSVMVRTSVHMEFIVSMRGWAIVHRSRNFDLPNLQLPTNLHHHPASPRLPY